MDNLLLKSIADSVQELTEDEQVSTFTLSPLPLGHMADTMVSGSLISDSLQFGGLLL